MHFNEVQQAIERRPFQPLTLRLRNGKEFYIPYQEIVSISRGSLMVVLGDRPAEAVACLRADQIESIRTVGVHMVLEAIRQAIRRQPFKSFTLRLADGRELSVPHPEFIAISGRTVIVTNATDELYQILEPFLIVSIDYADGMLGENLAEQEGGNP